MWTRIFCSLWEKDLREQLINDRWLLRAIRRLKKMITSLYPKRFILSLNLEILCQAEFQKLNLHTTFPHKISLYHKWISYCKNILFTDIGKCPNTHSIWIKYIFWFWFQEKKHSCNYEMNHCPFTFIYTTWKLICIEIVWHRHNSLLNTRENLILVPV